MNYFARIRDAVDSRQAFQNLPNQREYLYSRKVRSRQRLRRLELTLRNCSANRSIRLTPIEMVAAPAAVLPSLQRPFLFDAGQFEESSKHVVQGDQKCVEPRSSVTNK